MPENCENWLGHVNNCVYYARQNSWNLPDTALLSGL